MSEFIPEFNSFQTDSSIDDRIEGCNEAIKLLLTSVKMNQDNTKVYEMISKITDAREDLLNEAKVTYKRKYTETHPAKIVYAGARVRKAVFDAMKDGRISEQELKDILEKIGAQKRWAKKNKHLFELSEEEGSKYYTLSKMGKRILSKLPMIKEEK